jgi:hypothetical protein
MKASLNCVVEKASASQCTANDRKNSCRLESSAWQGIQNARQTVPKPNRSIGGTGCGVSLAELGVEKSLLGWEDLTGS